MNQKKKRDALGIPGDRYAEISGVQGVGKGILPKDPIASDSITTHAITVRETQRSIFYFKAQQFILQDGKLEFVDVAEITHRAAEDAIQNQAPSEPSPEELQQLRLELIGIFRARVDLLLFTQYDSDNLRTADWSRDRSPVDGVYDLRQQYIASGKYPYPGRVAPWIIDFCRLPNELGGATSA